jgi:hypothetical protein
MEVRSSNWPRSSEIFHYYSFSNQGRRVGYLSLSASMNSCHKYSCKSRDFWFIRGNFMCNFWVTFKNYYLLSSGKLTDLQKEITLPIGWTIVCVFFNPIVVNTPKFVWICNKFENLWCNENDFTLWNVVSDWVCSLLIRYYLNFYKGM